MKRETDVSLFRSECDMNQMNVDGVAVAVEKKKIKHMYIRVVPPNGDVNLTAPWNTSEQAMYRFVLSKIDWVKEKQRLYAAVVPYDYATGEIHDLWGAHYVLRIADVEKSNAPRRRKSAVECTGGEIILSIAGQSNRKKRENLLNNFYPKQNQVCRQEGEWLLKALAGDAPALESLKKSQGTTPNLRVKYWQK